MNALTVLTRSYPVLPVAQFASDDHARACAELFNEAGVPAIEVTLRHESAWQHLRICRDIMRNSLVGVGTVTRGEQLLQAADSADFAISPGFSPQLGAQVSTNFAYIPGVATASEVLQAMQAGFTALKLFPAEAVGGRALLKALGGPFPEVRFCPTGGIGEQNLDDYLTLDNVVCVGGSWVVPDLDAINKNASALLKNLQGLYQNRAQTQ